MPGIIEQDMQRFQQAAQQAAANKPPTPKYGSGQYADPEGMAEIFRQMGAAGTNGQYAYKPDIGGINAAAGQHVAQILYSMPGADETMGGVSRLSRMMQGSLPVLQQKQQALQGERQFGANIQQQNLKRALAAYQNAQNTLMGNKQLQLSWDQFTEDQKMQREKLAAENSFGWDDALGLVGGVAGTALGGPLGGALGSAIFGGAGKAVG